MNENLNLHRICLYCGNEKKRKYEEYELYYECDCSDAKKIRKINKQIEKLEDSKPKEKFKVVTKNVLVDVNNNESSDNDWI